MSRAHRTTTQLYASAVTVTGLKRPSVDEFVRLSGNTAW